MVWWHTHTLFRQRRLLIFNIFSFFMYEVLVHMRKTHAHHFRTLPVTKGLLNAI